jgi:hypothetical protein
MAMTHKFNEEAANELVDEIGQIMLGDDALDNPKKTSICTSKATRASTSWAERLTVKSEIW